MPFDYGHRGPWTIEGMSWTIEELMKRRCHATIYYSLGSLHDTRCFGAACLSRRDICASGTQRLAVRSRHCYATELSQAILCVITSSDYRGGVRLRIRRRSRTLCSRVRSDRCLTAGSPAT